jgi:hypothetical protein
VILLLSTTIVLRKRVSNKSSSIAFSLSASLEKYEFDSKIRSTLRLRIILFHRPARYLQDDATKGHCPSPMLLSQCFSSHRTINSFNIPPSCPSSSRNLNTVGQEEKSLHVDVDEPIPPSPRTRERVAQGVQDLVIQHLTEVERDSLRKLFGPNWEMKSLQLGECVG